MANTEITGTQYGSSEGHTKSEIRLDISGTTLTPQYIILPQEDVELFTSTDVRSKLYKYTVHWNVADGSYYGGVFNVISVTQYSSAILTTTQTFATFLTQVGGAYYGTKNFPVASTNQHCGRRLEDLAYLYVSKESDGKYYLYINFDFPSKEATKKKITDPITVTIVRQDIKGDLL